LLCIRNAKCISKGVLKSNGFTQVYNGGGWVAYKTKYNERTNFIKWLEFHALSVLIVWVYSILKPRVYSLVF
jgi:hypothetical protein